MGSVPAAAPAKEPNNKTVDHRPNAPTLRIVVVSFFVIIVLAPKTAE
jgi:hypothetical protein